MQKGYKASNPAVKRIMREMQEMETDPNGQYTAHALEDNIFEWHFTVRGPPDTAFEGGIYHGRILLPADYPFKPPDIVLLTPNGRFEVGTKICLTISAHHPESWQPSWSIRTVLLALIGFMPTKGEGALGALDYPDDERRALAKQSVGWRCPKCGPISSILNPNAPAIHLPHPVDSSLTTTSATTTTTTTTNASNMNTNTTLSSSSSISVDTATASSSPLHEGGSRNEAHDNNNNKDTESSSSVSTSTSVSESMDTTGPTSLTPLHRSRSSIDDDRQEPSSSSSTSFVSTRRPEIEVMSQNTGVRTYLDYFIVVLFGLIVALLWRKLA